MHHRRMHQRRRHLRQPAMRPMAGPMSEEYKQQVFCLSNAELIRRYPLWADYIDFRKDVLDAGICITHVFVVDTHRSTEVKHLFTGIIFPTLINKLSKFVSKIKIRKRQIDILCQKYGFVNDTNNIIQAKNNEFLNEVLNDTIQCVKKHIEKRKNYQNNKNNKENKEKKTMTRMKKSYWHSNCLLITSTSWMIHFCLIVIVVILMNTR